MLKALYSFQLCFESSVWPIQQYLDLRILLVIIVSNCYFYFLMSPRQFRFNSLVAIYRVKTDISKF